MLRKIHWKQLTSAQQKLILQRPATAASTVLQQTQQIINRVRAEGDTAIKQLTKQFDSVELQNIKVSEDELIKAEVKIDEKVKNAMITAAHNIKIFHQMQYPKNNEVTTAPGISCAVHYKPIQRVGLYIPGGTAVLPSTVLMLAIPANIAGCPLRILCSPPRADGSMDPTTLFAAKLCGIDQVYKMGGAQAVAAMAFGTDTVPKADKIFGPGNRWVTQAKLLVAQEPDGAAYDIPAGPSEQMLIADDSANPEFVAADLLSQAEHGADSQVILICFNEQFATKVNTEIALQLNTLPRREVIEKSLTVGSAIIVEDLMTAVAIANQYAPEHLLLQINNPRQIIDQIHSAGSVFLGPWSAESVGDYASGTNHVLPTYGYARSFSGLGVSDFMKRITFQELTEAGLKSIAPTVATLARVEGLEAHARAVTLRTDKLNSPKNKPEEIVCSKK